MLFSFQATKSKKKTGVHVPFYIDAQVYKPPKKVLNTLCFEVCPQNEPKETPKDYSNC